MSCFSDLLHPVFSSDYWIAAVIAHLVFLTYKIIITILKKCEKLIEKLFANIHQFQFALNFNE